MKVGGTAASRGRHFLRVAFVLMTMFTAGLVTSGVVAGAGPLAVLSDSTATETSTESTPTSTESTSESTTTDEGTTSDETTTDSTTTESTATETEPTTTESTPAPSGPPTIASDQADYAPGALVTLTGTNWRPDESVTIDVNDNQGQTWRRTVDVVADANGQIVDRFNLPDWFVATYAVVARGSLSGTATTTFTDGNVQVQTNSGGPTVTLTYSRFSASGCTGTETGPSMVTISPTSGSTILFAQDNGSFQLSVPGTSGTQTFDKWTAQANFESTNNPLCFNAINGNRTFSANYIASTDTTPPTVTSINRSGTSPTNTTGNVTWTVVFSESVTGVGTGDFTLANAGLSGPAIGTVTGGPTSYTVTASSGTGSGTLGLNLVDDDSIVDGAGNKLGGTNPGNGNFTGEVYVIDRAPPTVTAAAVTLPGSAAYTANTWTNKDVRVTFTCADTGGSSLTAGSGNQVQDFTTNTAAAGTTATFSGTCADQAGNSASASTFGPIKIDKTAPTASVLSVKKADTTAYTPGTWTNQSVIVDFACTDGLSGVASLTPDPVTLATSGEDQSASSTCTDNAGNTHGASQANIDIDKTAPGISFDGQSPAKNANGWNKTDVTLSWTCTDVGGSGVVSGTVSKTITSEGMGQTDTGTCTDLAGNTSSSTDGNVNIDKTAPVVAVTGVANGASYTVGSVPSTGCTTSDALSGVKTNGTLQPLTGPGTTNSNGVGSFTATCNGAEDNAGNIGTASVTFTVIYGGFVRFLQPINNTAHDLGNNPDVSTFKAGSTVPTKVQVKLANGTIVQPSSALWVIPEKRNATSQAVDETVYTEPATNGTTYVWNATDRFYQYNWATPKTGAGFYWLIGVKLDDGQTYKVYISLR